MTTQGGEGACSVLGLDISSFQLTACLLIDGQPPVLRTEIIGKQGKDALVDRLGRIPLAMARLMKFERRVPAESASWPAFYASPRHIDFVVVEEPFGGKNIPKALLMTAGACLASVQPPARPWLITPMDWRAAIGARNTKPAGHEAVDSILRSEYGHDLPALLGYTHDELDAIGVALGARAILAGQVAA